MKTIKKPGQIKAEMYEKLSELREDAAYWEGYLKAIDEMEEAVYRISCTEEEEEEEEE